MTTLIAGARAVDVPELTESGAEEANRLLADAMEERFGGSWEVVPGGEAVGEWNRLARGNNCDLPTEEQREYSGRVFERLWDESPEHWWETAQNGAGG